MSWLQRAWARIVAATSRAEPPVQDDDVHFSPDRDPTPLCGARVGAPWARNVEAVTCLRCREMAMPLLIQHDANTR